MKHKIIIALILFSFSLFNQSFAQVPVYKRYTTLSGLPHDITYQIMQDNKGYVWVGTDDGLTKFSGNEFINYSYKDGLQSNYVIDIIEKGFDEYIIGTWGRGVHYLKNDSIYKPQISNDQNIKVRNVYELNDSIIYGARNAGFYLYNLNQNKMGEYFYSFNENKKISSFELHLIEETSVNLNVNENFIDSSLYIYASEIQSSFSRTMYGVYKFINNELIQLDYPELNQLYVHAISKTKNYFFAASYNTVYKFKGEKLIDKKKINILDEKIIHLQTQGENIYFISLNVKDGTRKIYKYNWSSSQLINLSYALEIKSFISDFMFDNSGALWITTYGQGVYYLPNTSNRFFNKQTFDNPDLKEIDTLNQSLILLSPNLLYSFKNDSVEKKVGIPYHTESFQLVPNVRKIDLISFQSFDVLGGINGYKLKSAPHKKFKFKSGQTTIFLEYNLVKVYKNNFLINEYELEIRDSYLKKSIKIENKIYAIYDKVGIIVIDSNTGKLITVWNKNSGFFTNYFKDIVVDDNGEIWLASDVGVIKVSANDKKWYTTKDGLTSNHINDLLIDKYGVLWIATQKGLNVFNQNAFYTIDQNLGQQSSFVTKVIEHKNFIYATGNNGLFKMDNKHPYKAFNHTKLFVEQDGAKFKLETINYRNANSIKIAYRLNNAEWVETNNLLLNFQNNKQQEYTIQFKYKDNLSDWNYSSVYKFRITLPWYEQLWLYVAVISSLALIIIMVIYRQLKKSIHKTKMIELTLKEREELQEKLKNVRHQIAQDFHDDLGNKLASISILSKISLQKITKDNALYKSLHQIKDDSNSLFLDMRDFVWSLDSNNNKLFEVQLYLNDFGEQLFENTSINFKSINNVFSSNIVLPHYWNKELVLTFKEAMTNALRHSEASQIIFEVNLMDEILEISLIDNGVGFDFDKLKRVNGIKNMKSRVENIGGKLIYNSNNKGTEVYFKASINKFI